MDYARTFKHHRYDAGFVGSRYDFAAMVFESTGAVCSEGEEVLRQLMRFAALREGVGFSSFAGRMWARLSCCIQVAVAQQILNRDVSASPLDLDVDVATVCSGSPS